MVAVIAALWQRAEARMMQARRCESDNNKWLFVCHSQKRNMHAQCHGEARVHRGIPWFLFCARHAHMQSNSSWKGLVGKGAELEQRCRFKSHYY